jgi:hypothetical protein
MRAEKAERRRTGAVSPAKQPKDAATACQKSQAVLQGLKNLRGEQIRPRGEMPGSKLRPGPAGLLSRSPDYFPT